LCSKDLFLLIGPFTRKCQNYVMTTEFRVGNIVPCMRFVYWIHKAKSKHLSYIILLFSIAKLVTKLCLNIFYIPILLILYEETFKIGLFLG